MSRAARSTSSSTSWSTSRSERSSSCRSATSTSGQTKVFFAAMDSEGGTSDVSEVPLASADPQRPGRDRVGTALPLPGHAAHATGTASPRRGRHRRDRRQQVVPQPKLRGRRLMRRLLSGWVGVGRRSRRRAAGSLEGRGGGSQEGSGSLRQRVARRAGVAGSGRRRGVLGHRAGALGGGRGSGCVPAPLGSRCRGLWRSASCWLRCSSSSADGGCGGSRTPCDSSSGTVASTRSGGKIRSAPVPTTTGRTRERELLPSASPSIRRTTAATLDRADRRRSAARSADRMRWWRIRAVSSCSRSRPCRGRSRPGSSAGSPRDRRLGCTRRFSATS